MDSILKKIILDKYKFIYSEKRLQGLQFKWHRLADPVDPLGPMGLCQWKPHGWQLSECMAREGRVIHYE